MLLARRSRHDRVAASLAARSDGELAALVQAAPLNRVGVGGGASRIDIDRVPVFVKRIPLTDRELTHPHSTANLFDLPARWQYGMYRLAGPGFGAWRELAARSRPRRWCTNRPLWGGSGDKDAVIADPSQIDQ
ncbi:hypothetical protein ACIA8K_40965, partial [Catenuloplanes sp. NPDC051500]